MVYGWNVGLRANLLDSWAQKHHLIIGRVNSDLDQERKEIKEKEEFIQRQNDHKQLLFPLLLLYSNGGGTQTMMVFKKYYYIK